MEGGLIQKEGGKITIGVRGNATIKPPAIGQKNSPDSSRGPFKKKRKADTACIELHNIVRGVRNESRGRTRLLIGLEATSCAGNAQHGSKPEWYENWGEKNSTVETTEISGKGP